MKLFQLDGVNLVLTSPYQFIDLSVKTGVVVGIITCFPVFLFYLLKFIRPALTPKEFRLLLKMLPISLLLFCVGFAFGVWVIQYVIILFSQVTTGFAVDNIWDLSNFLSQILMTGICLALVFQLPIVLTALLKLNIVTHKNVRAQRKMVYAALLVIAAVLPTTDLVSLALLTLIPIFLFEITLLLNKDRSLI